MHGVAGFETFTTNLGVRDDTPDFLVIRSTAPAPLMTAMFTTSQFPGPSVTISRRHLAQAAARGVVAVSKNANVGNGPDGEADASSILAAVASECGMRPQEFLIASTGIIGRRYPVARMLEGIRGMGARLGGCDFSAAARAIMTTDTKPKLVAAAVDGATIVGIAKGVGMIEPKMATLFSFWFTDARIDESQFAPMFRRVMDETFNCLSIDTDTSTSDTALLMASQVGPGVAVPRFEAAFRDAAERLTKIVAADGEGATKLITVTVTGAEDDDSARRIAKSIVNSPLVKTAVHGADPNWGRILMAAGKTERATIDPAQLRVSFGDIAVYPQRAAEVDLVALTDALKRPEVDIGVDLGSGGGRARVWGCDLSQGYVTINASYST